MAESKSESGYGLSIEVKATSDGKTLTVLNIDYPAGALGSYKDFLDTQEAVGLALVNGLIALGRRPVAESKK